MEHLIFFIGVDLGNARGMKVVAAAFGPCSLLKLAEEEVSACAQC